MLGCWGWGVGLCVGWLGGRARLGGECRGVRRFRFGVKKWKNQHTHKNKNK